MIKNKYENMNVDWQSNSIGSKFFKIFQIMLIILIIQIIIIYFKIFDLSPKIIGMLVAGPIILGITFGILFLSCPKEYKIYNNYLYIKHVRNQKSKIISNEYKQLILNLKLNHPYNFEKGIVIEYPTVINLNEIHSYYLGKNPSESGFIVIMSNGDIITGGFYDRKFFKIIENKLISITNKNQKKY